jgi:hypothetical protein
MDTMNKLEACDWVHVHLIIDEMPFEDLVAAFTALAGRVPGISDRPDGLFRRCCEMVGSLTDVSSHQHRETTRIRSRRVR